MKNVNVLEDNFLTLTTFTSLIYSLLYKTLSMQLLDRNGMYIRAISSFSSSTWLMCVSVAGGSGRYKCPLPLLSREM